jgi:ribosomal-protein-alanine N-acetyltransferase
MPTNDATSPNPVSLETARLILRPWLDRDREPFARMSADPQVMAHLLPFASPEAVDAWIDRQQVHLETHGFCFWAVESKADGTFIGAAGLLRVGYEAHFTPAVEVGWRLDRRFWGQGYAPEAAARAIRFGFEHLDLQEIVANTVPANRNSRRVMEKLGMSHTAADDFDHPLVPIEHPLRRQVLYRLSRDKWSGRDSTSRSL